MDTITKNNNPDKWKDKYLNLLEEIEVLEKLNQKKEHLLCKTISHISHAAKGFNENLDPCLHGIQEQINQGINTDQLKSELEKFSKAMMSLEEINTVDSTLLFDYLLHHHPELKDDLNVLKEKFEQNNPDKKYFFKKIIDLINSIQQTSSSYIGTLPKDFHVDNVDSETVSIHLYDILDGSEIPAKFEPKVRELKQKLQNNIPPAVVLDETVSLLFEIKQHLQSEQQDIASFLTQVTDQLADLGIKASGAFSASKTSAKKRNLLDESVSSEVLELQKYSESATELEPLKKLIHTRLENISLQIHNHQSQEQLERDQAQQELEALSNKINKMEKESRLLKDKLIIANQKAIHDPLTGLPNRLAYDNQLAIELARWKRYQTPLSILIWDIDHFKKINDTYGHKAGDKTLILIAKLLNKYCRETDFVSRFGGEEFTMLLSNTDASSALKAANKIRQIIEKTAFNSNSKKISITISCGISQFTGDDTGKSAFERADKALYEAKSKGRNQCVIA